MRNLRTSLVVLMAAISWASTGEVHKLENCLKSMRSCEEPSSEATCPVWWRWRPHRKRSSTS